MSCRFILLTVVIAREQHCVAPGAHVKIDRFGHGRQDIARNVRKFDGGSMGPSREIDGNKADVTGQVVPGAGVRVRGRGGSKDFADDTRGHEAKAPQARDCTNQRVRRGGEIDEVQRSKNRNKSKVRARVEHVFAVVKRLWGFSKVRYRGLAKNATRSFVALGLANIYLARRSLA